MLHSTLWVTMAVLVLLIGAATHWLVVLVVFHALVSAPRRQEKQVPLNAAAD